MDGLSLIKFPIIDELEQFRELFNSSLANSNLLLNEVLVHIRKRNGKMMRPILVLLMAKLYGKVSDVTLRAAVGLELLHTASLVHDDVVDESSERRGQASVNAMYNNKVSVLVGDYLLATCLLQSSLTGRNDIVEVIARLGQSLSEGELLQLSSVSNSDISEEVYTDVIRKKTADLFAACTVAGALSVGATIAEVKKARLFGEYIGLCFQIKDDIFDYYDSTEIGKPTGNDIREGKLTLPAIYAVNTYGDTNIHSLAYKIKSGEATDAEISNFIKFVKQNKGIDYAYRIMLRYREMALDLLSDIPDSVVKSSLVAYVDYVVDRTK